MYKSTLTMAEIRNDVIVVYRTNKRYPTMYPVSDKNYRLLVHTMLKASFMHRVIDNTEYWHCQTNSNNWWKG